MSRISAAKVLLFSTYSISLLVKEKDFSLPSLHPKGSSEQETAATTSKIDTRQKRIYEAFMIKKSVQLTRGYIVMYDLGIKIIIIVDIPI